MADRLATYREKRDFSRTKEPQGKGKHPEDGFFIVQKHDATRLHYDFRIALDGVLVSWAVTKGPSYDTREKRLAVRTEDHPLDYADFEGTIPKGEYGGGTVMLWDRGAYEAVEDPREGLEKGSLKLKLEGERLRGRFALVRMKPRKGEKRENWLMIKEKDERVDPDWEIDTFLTSIDTGRTMDEIAAHAPAGGNARAAAKKGAAKRQRAASRKTASSTPKSGLPKFVAPQLATLVDEAPSGEGWLHEVKYDGYRLIVAADGDDVRCYTRSGQDWTDRFPMIAKGVAKLGLHGALLDGEAVVADAEGRTDFGSLQQALSEGGPISYFVFDLLALGGRDLTGERLIDRKAELATLVPKGGHGPVYYSDHVEGHGDRMAGAACTKGLEGIVSKRADAPYRSTRSRSWLKIKCVKAQEFVICGYTPSTKRRFSSIILGLWDGDQLRYSGRVGTGFDDATLDDLMARFEPLERKTPAVTPVPADIRRKARWLKPELAAEIRFTEITRDGSVRHGVFVGLREDKPAREIGREVAEDVQTVTARSGSGGDGAIAGVRLTNPDKVLYASAKATKRDVAEYFDAVADAMLPHLQGRAVSLVRCPEGRQSSCFFQKHASKGMPPAFGSVDIPEKDGGTEAYITVPSREALVSCAQIGALELHLWGSRGDRIEQPDRLVFDLDPAEDLLFAEVRAAAREIAAILREGGLTSFPLATGGKGLHLVIPIARRHDWPVVTGFAKAFAQKIAEIDHSRFVATMTKAKRKGRIFIDHFRNQRGATAISPFSPRAREGAPVATPISWDELDDIEAGNVFRFADVVARLDGPDPWAGYATTRQRLTKTKLTRIGVALEG
ncbi:DNA ligase D [Lutibaculum baratangense]|uniref:DNA ligase (ATP) n=1 Tax=Lutibaculum baratangense AMV1 TaxID=631454 RepID=V4RD44_9HYPH|nr:DNA ligase D [Lutibaculum baratangense]ESR23314.1 ATP-dependent DNA ligase clustered with Ku protein, LigD [Lutibaculum baratangense AMV1]